MFKNSIQVSASSEIFTLYSYHISVPLLLVIHPARYPKPSSPVGLPRCLYLDVFRPPRYLCCGFVKLTFSYQCVKSLAMLVPWLWVALCVSQCTCGSSLRGAVEALQRRQRGQRSPTVADYDALYEFVPPGYSEPDYAVDVDYADEEPEKYIVKLIDDNDRVRPLDGYEYKIVKKDNRMQNSMKKSAFREGSQKDNDKLKDLFNESNEPDDKKESSKARADNEAEYEMLLNQLWSKYKNSKDSHKSVNSAPQGIVKLYKEKEIKKRYADDWGPIAYKRKRSSGFDQSVSQDNEPERKDDPDSNYNAYDVSNDDKNDWREEYAIAFQPLDDDSVSEPHNDDKYSIGSIENSFSVNKRSSYGLNTQNKRYLQNRSDKTRAFRSSSGTDPRIIKDLSKIFGDNVEIIKTPVKRNTDHQSSTHDGAPSILGHNNNTHGHPNYTHHEIDSHEQHQSHMHHPGHEGMKEVDPGRIITHDHNQNHGNHGKQIQIRKKSIDWSDYFGIDKRAKKFLNDGSEIELKKQYFDTFNKEVIHPLKAPRKHRFVKRNYVQDNLNQESDSHAAPAEDRSEEEKQTSKDASKLESLDKKLRDMEGMLVDEALHYSDSGEELDSKEEQEMKEKLLSELAAAYSLEKMRKALKEFKQNLQTQRPPHPATPTDQMKVKRVAVKKELLNNDIPAFNKQPGKFEGFEEEQGAGHYLNGREHQFSEGYMGSGRHRSPASSTMAAPGACPVLAKIVHRCRSVDILAGDPGQLFLPLCSLYQICYLCGQAPQTTCDMLFISEADTFCEGNMLCQQSARVALMALRDLHDNLADELDGECESSPCLPQALKLNQGWQRALQR